MPSARENCPKRLNGFSISFPSNGPSDVASISSLVCNFTVVAPVDLADDDEIGRGVVGRAVPFRPARAAGAEMNVLPMAKGSSTFSILVTGVR